MGPSRVPWYPLVASVLNDILDTVVVQVQQLLLTLDGVPVPVVKRKLPKTSEELDPATQITVSTSEIPEEVKPFAFGGIYKVKYNLQIAVISPNNRDQASNIDVYAAWRETIRTLFETKAPLASVSAVMDVDAIPEVFLDRGKIAANYDYQVVGIRVTTIERRT